MKYILGIDQSTQGTKAILFDENGLIVNKVMILHEQIVNEVGWVSHNPEEIYCNVLAVVKQVVDQAAISKEHIVGVGISNQRETTVAWNKQGEVLADAVVWQCARATEIAERYANKAEEIYKKTGLPLSPYFPAAKMAWLIENEIKEEDYYLGTIDSWITYKLTRGLYFRTDYSNASRTQLFNLHTLEWDQELCELFNIPIKSLPEVHDSNSCFGYTDFDGYFDKKIPIQGVMGDSHAALYGQGCHEKGMIKATYGTGSSVMMHVGEQYIQSESGLATSLAWGIDGKVSYVVEGNINYTGAVVTWLKNDMKLIDTIDEIEEQIMEANEEDTSVLVPAFTGLSAPYWDGNAKALLYGMTRTTGRAEIIKAAIESIAYQISDVIYAVKKDTHIPLQGIRVDGGPTKNRYLMQFQSDISKVKVCVPNNEELSAIGVAYLAGITLGLYDKDKVFQNFNYTQYEPLMGEQKRRYKYISWNTALSMVLKDK